MKFSILKIFILLWSTSLIAVPLHERLQWKRFLYLDSSGESMVTTDEFFVLPHGAQDPKAELEATVAALQDPNAREEVFCRMPARSRWLIDELHLEWTEISCTEFSKYRELVDAHSAWIVFASYYLNTPASAYGHTLLRLGRKDNIEADALELLDYSINFSANTDTENPFLYTYKGLSGGFPGIFTALPYYYKIREYNDFEARDLWSYKINLTPKQLEKLVELIWELDHAQFDYYFLTKNCSYFLLALLDAVDEDFSFVDQLSYFVIPIDTVKVLQSRPHFVGHATYRPSPRARFWAHWERLKPDLKDFYQQHALENFSPLPEKFLQSEQISLLDINMAHLDYVYPKDILNSHGPGYEKKRPFLLARSKIHVPSPETPVVPGSDQSPDQSHPSRKLSLALGATRQFSTDAPWTSYEDLRWRFAFHELADAPDGHALSSLNMGDIRLRHERVDGRSVFRLNHATLFDIFNINPVNTFSTPTSWRARFGLRDYRFDDAPNAYGIELNGSVGLSALPLNNESLLLYGFLGMGVDTIKNSEGMAFHTQGQIGPQVGIWGRGFGHRDTWQMEMRRTWVMQSKGLQTHPNDFLVRYNWNPTKERQLQGEWERLEDRDFVSLQASVLF